MTVVDRADRPPQVRSILRRGYRNILLNLAAMTSSDAGISALLGALHLTREAGAELKLLHVTRRLKVVLIMVALHGYFATFDSEADAWRAVDLWRLCPWYQAARREIPGASRLKPPETRADAGTDASAAHAPECRLCRVFRIRGLCLRSR